MLFIIKPQSYSALKVGIEQAKIPLVIALRFRYHKDKIERGPLHRLGYKDKILTHGLLPRSKDFGEIKSMKLRKPLSHWTEEKALYGRNDYIDILGDGNLKPTDVCYNVPMWLRGFKGNEYQMLLRRRKLLGHHIKEHQPLRYSDMNRRIKYLYNFLNFKTKDYFWKKP